MAGPHKTYIVHLPQDADFKQIRTETYERGGYLQVAHQKHNKEGLRAYKLNAPEDVLVWFRNKHK